ncbi:MAG: hypothetical protein OZSIB_4276 [Candidatus Ozemobacter sibiricus]|uniref:Uncharacterized protein n=1 Tax=Candidatus Ozemobacter sibiricus TaxID=2268124 RepID=A0A367ZQ71_9BACT|nr:MAG: hypothetical protein OZSIB_4276 [Candidatus Ozemobacter sibiricus]
MLKRALVSIVLLLSMVGRAGPVVAEPSRFFMGEDIIGPDGLVISVNQVQRRPFTGGLSSERKEQIEIELTLVNSGRASLAVDPQKDFSLTFGGPVFFPTAQTSADAASLRPFTVHPGTQSRLTLSFQVLADQARGDPELRFTGTPEPLVVVCDPTLAQLSEQSQRGPLLADDALRLGRHLFEAERYRQARQVVEGALGRAGSDPRLLLQMALIEQKLGNPDGARTYLTRIGLQTRLDGEDALQLARQAFEVGEYELVVKVLDPLQAEGRLGDKDLILLARALYYRKEYDRSERLLQEMLARGIKDKTIYFTLGNIAEKRDEIRVAIGWWEKAYDLDKTYYEALFNLGVGYYKTDDRQKAGEAWRRVLLLNPDPETRQIAEDALAGLE